MILRRYPLKIYGSGGEMVMVMGLGMGWMDICFADFDALLADVLVLNFSL
jgi:hypothetical protein